MSRKNLKGVEIDSSIPNTVVVDIYGLSEPLRIIGIYWPASQQRNLMDLSNFVINNTLIAGDFNAAAMDWGSPTDDNRSFLLKEWIEENDLLYVKNTFNSSRRSKRNIDHLFTNIRNVKGETIAFGTSDHWPIIYTSNTISYHTHSSFPHTSWKEYEVLLCLLQDFWFDLQKSITLDDWYKLYIRFLGAAKNRVTTWKNKEKFRPALPEFIRNKLKELRKVRNNYYRKRRYDIDNEAERILLRTLNREVQADIANYRSKRWSNFFEKIQESKTKNDVNFWSHLGKLYKQKSLPFAKLKVNNKIISDKEIIAQELYKYYTDQFQPPYIDRNDPHDSEIENEFQDILKSFSNSMEIEQTNIKEICYAIKSLKPKKSAGYDSISNFMLKLLPPGYLQCLWNCFNLWLKECRFPHDWKVAKVISLNKLKTGIPSSDQTRPISLLATHSKIFEKLLLVRIRNWAELNSIIPVEQSGFRPNCSIPTRVLSIYQEIQNNLVANVPTLSIYVDYQKAYDKVWHAALIVKLN
ncbi:unnamed protein product [Rotaria socialis]|uniref:Reverse transcriptase domain-containing protein n=1 Tax=Rotaria socialis TaxID=392032 RepID=A0A820NJ42_9BILA|nr:unnamed protein product [Rotaria socialis]CAF4389538.1 unnamed protein product [Rotaria socialis]